MATVALEFANGVHACLHMGYLLPGVGEPAALVGLVYGIYLFALGLPRLMHTPREQLVPFMVVCALVLIVVNILLTLVMTGPRAI